MFGTMTAPEGGSAAVTTGPTLGVSTASTGGGDAPRPADPAADDRFRDALAACLAPGLVLERELAGGGMARVFVAHEAALGRRVVVKVLPPELAAGVNRERFRREVQLAAQLQHPHIVPLLAAGEVGAAGPDAATAAAAGSLYYTMPFIEGESLRAEAAARAARGEGFSAREVRRLLHDVAGALGYAHRRGVVHRDVKPGNVLLQHGHALVTDFGVAKALGAGGTAGGPGAMTTVGMAIGTPAYMAPEQLAADPAADHRADLYAAGLVAYELLTGASPFAAASPQATLAAQLTRDPAPLETLRPDVPPALAAAVTACLAKDPAARPASAEALLALLDADADSGETARRAAPAGAADAATGDAPATVAVETPGGRRGRRPARAGLVLAGLATVAAAAGLWRAFAPARPATAAASTASASTRVAQGAAVAPAAVAGAGSGAASAAGTPAAQMPGSAAPAAGAAATAPTLSRADSVAIAAAVAREFERAQRRAAAGPTPVPSGVSGATSAGGEPPRRVIIVGPPPSTAALRRTARDKVADSLVRGDAWAGYSREVVRAVVGRLPAGLGLPPEARREIDEALREAHGAAPAPPAPPSAPGEAGEARDGRGDRFRGFAAVAATLPPPAPGARRVAFAGLRDGTGRPELARLATHVEHALRTQLAGGAGRYEVTHPGVAALARRERVPDAVVAGATGAGAVVRGLVDATRDDGIGGGTVSVTLLVYDARRGAVVPVSARAPFGPGTPVPALANALAAGVARDLDAALGAAGWGGGR
jgi:serine/threonine-protein kinase